MPCNLYGPGDKFDETSSHVIPALMIKAHEAKMSGDTLTVWGSGKPKREFLYVDDLADALVFALKNYSSPKPLNIGAGADMTIAELTAEIVKTVGFKGKIVFDETKPDGVMKKLMDSSRIFAAGWTPKTDLVQGLRMTYDWYQSQERLRDAA
jgi:GDP-L-fucose synthase